MRLNVKFYLLLGVLSGLFLGGCRNEYAGSEKDRLTPSEEAAVVAHTRKFLLDARTLKITPAEREVIRNGKPEVHIRYTGYKQGNLSIRWKLPQYRVLLLQRSGALLSSGRADWTIRLITDQASGKIPGNFYGANGEDLSLPPL